MRADYRSQPQEESMEPTQVKFGFKGKKKLDDAGNPIMVDEVKEYKVKNKDGTEGTELRKTGKQVPDMIPAPDPYEVSIPLFKTKEDVLSILDDEKQLALALEGLNGVILEQARDQVNAEDFDREKGIDVSALSWEAIANLPPAQRRGPAIPDEKWDEFVADYIEVMQHHGKTKEKAEAGAKLLRQKFQPVRLNKLVVGALKTNLSLWFANSDKNEYFQDIYENLASKADTLLAVDEEALAAAI
jgi:hypothetical protein